MVSPIKKLKEFLFNRKMAYLQVFNPENVFTKIVINDLRKFCRAEKSTFHPDERVHCLLEGRREVWLRIEQHLELSHEEFVKLYGKVDINE